MEWTLRKRWLEAKKGEEPFGSSPNHLVVVTTVMVPAMMPTSPLRYLSAGLVSAAAVIDQIRRWRWIYSANPTVRTHRARGRVRRRALWRRWALRKRHRAS